MATITQDMRYRLSLIKYAYAQKYGIAKSAVKWAYHSLDQTQAARLLTLYSWPLPLFQALGYGSSEAFNPKYIPKPYEQMLYPGQRVQINVRHVPSSYLVGDASGQKSCQYTALRWVSPKDTLFRFLIDGVTYA